MVRPRELGLPEVRVVRNPTTELLDKENVFMSPSVREPLEQKRSAQFKQKGIKVMQEKIKQIEQKLEQTKQKLVADEAELARLREQRGRLFVEDSKKHATQIAKLDNTIEQLRNFITNTPACIVILEQQLAEAKQKHAAENRDALLNQQKETAKLCKELSKELVRLLAEAVKVNKKLDAAYRQYQGLHELTKVDLLGAKACEPSAGMLEYLFSFLKAELEEGKHCRTLLPGHPQI